MPHVFTLEGANIEALQAVSFPPAGSPLAPHAAIIGPTRVATPVFGPGGTPQMYRRRYPDRGPVCDYCDTSQFAVMSGGQTVIPYRRQQFGDASSFIARQSPVTAGAIMVGGSLAVGGALGGFAAWLIHRIASRSKQGR